MSMNTENVIADYEMVRDRVLDSLQRCQVGRLPVDTNKRDMISLQQCYAAVRKENAELRAELEWAKALLSMYQMSQR